MPEIAKKRLDRMLSAAKSAGARLRGAASGAKASGIAAVVGAAASYGHELAEQKVDFFDPQKNPDHWYMTPAALIVGGHFLRRKNDAAGLAMIGAGGYALRQAYADHQAATGSSTAPAATAGLSDAGRIVSRVFSAPNAGALKGPRGLSDAGRTIPRNSAFSRARAA